MKKYNWDIEKIKEITKDSVNFTEVLQKLNIPRQGNNSKTLKRILNENNIDYSHFTGRARSYNSNYTEVENYLNNSKSIKSSKLKEKLLKEKLLENKCSKCGISDWLGNPLVLQLHHIDGNNQNNSLDNLQLLCPNCHSQTENYCGNSNKNVKKYYCSNCGKEITKNAKYCPICAFKHRRKVERPNLEQLILDFKELKSFTQVGIKYQVSDNSVKKWCIYYNIPSKIKELQNYISIQ